MLLQVPLEDALPSVVAEGFVEDPIQLVGVLRGDVMSSDMNSASGWSALRSSRSAGWNTSASLLVLPICCPKAVQWATNRNCVVVPCRLTCVDSWWARQGLNL
jgi:hypothetical protein